MRITQFANQGNSVHDWLLIDAAGKTMGRLASEIAKRLQGKHKTNYTPHFSVGDFIIVVNADKIHFTGNKWAQKVYYRHSGYPGGLKAITAEKQLEKEPTKLLYSAVKGMLPKNALARKTIRKLKIYTGANHPHSSQKPETVNL